MNKITKLLILLVLFLSACSGNGSSNTQATTIEVEEASSYKTE